jgi:two-component system chemotaxis response regulator CheY
MERLTIKQIAVLLIEPSKAQLMVIEKAIRDAGVENIERVKSGSEGLEEAERYPPDLIVSSLYLPDMTGSDLLETLRNNPRTAAIPFMLISSETKFDVLDPVRQAGAVAILPKPFTQDQINQALYATLDILDPDLLGVSPIDIESLKVLLVDDSILAREHMQRLLKSIGITDITEASDGRQAIGIIEDESFDLVISDYNMPNIDGKGLTVHIRKHSHLAGVPILMVTSEENHDRLAALHASGVSAICNKPFDLKNIRDLIEQVVS